MTEPPRDANAAFIGFCKKWYEKRGPGRYQAITPLPIIPSNLLRALRSVFPRSF